MSGHIRGVHATIPIPSHRYARNVGSRHGLLTRRISPRMTGGGIPEESKRMEHISVRYFDTFSRDDLKNPVLLEGLPGIGHLGIKIYSPSSSIEK